MAALAWRQHGLMSRRQLTVLGIRANAVAHRVALGRLHRVHQGVYALGHLERTSGPRWMAAVIACGSGTVLSHLDAAALWGIYKGAGALVHVTTTSARGRTGRVFGSIARGDFTPRTPRFELGSRLRQLRGRSLISPTCSEPIAYCEQ